MFKHVWLRISPIQRIAQIFQLNFPENGASSENIAFHAFDLFSRVR